MSIRYAVVPEITPELETGLLRLWTDVTNAGGAVGFVPPVGTEDVRPAWERHRRDIELGQARRLAGLDADGVPRAAAFVQLNTHPLMRHWVWLYRVMVHPDRQGGGEGRRLMEAAAAVASGLDGIRAIRLSCRGGLGLERFYESCGYKEVGRVPDALMVGEHDLREEITLLLPL
jgi:GNAT superfamily N-acetyltransferase